jgi:hypothetical protein
MGHFNAAILDGRRNRRNANPCYGPTAAVLRSFWVLEIKNFCCVTNNPIYNLSMKSSVLCILALTILGSSVASLAQATMQALPSNTKEKAKLPTESAKKDYRPTLNSFPDAGQAFNMAWSYSKKTNPRWFTALLIRKISCGSFHVVDSLTSYLRIRKPL